MGKVEVSIEAQLSEHADAIRGLGRRVVADVVELGRRLTEAKALCRHGDWLPWLEREFKFTDETARKWMQVYELSLKFQPNWNLDLPLGTLYLIAKPSMPPEARDEVFERLERGEKLTKAEVAEVEKRFDVRPVERPAEPPREMTATIRDKPATPPETVAVKVGKSAPAPAPQFPIHTQNLRWIVLELEQMLGDDLDEAAEYLIAKKQIARVVFEKTGGALSCIGNFQGDLAKTMAVVGANKYSDEEGNSLPPKRRKLH